MKLVRHSRGAQYVKSSKRPQHSEQAQAVLFVVLLVPALIVLAGLVIDGGRTLTADRAAYNEAAQAARLGANTLSRQTLYDQGPISIQENSYLAETNAINWCNTAEHPCQVNINGNTVLVHIIPYQLPTDLLGIIGISSMTVSANATANPVAGQ